ncbi:MAG: ABC transporter ATP-binding protein, partial [Clostridiales bacterium]|nr:ABC transporter ATP-binding protein [Clostridiales bacterium]
RILLIRDGKLFHQLVRVEETRRQFFDKIIEVMSLLGGDGNDVD